MAVLIAALKARQAELQHTIATAEGTRPRLDRKAVEQHVRERLGQSRALLTRHVGDGRQLLREVLTGPIRFTPEKQSGLIYRFEGEVALGRLFSGVASLAPFVASLSIPRWNQILTFLREMAVLREMAGSAA